MITSFRPVWFLIGLTLSLHGATPPHKVEAWTKIDPIEARSALTHPWIVPDEFSAFELNLTSLNAQLDQINCELGTELQQPDLTIDLPMPDGNFASFRIIESPVMEPALALEFPEIRTFRGHALNDPASTVRLSISPYGFSSQILSPDGACYIDRLDRDDPTRYACYTRRNYSGAHAPLSEKKERVPGGSKHGFTCEIRRKPAKKSASSESSPPRRARSSGTTLRTYKIAVACTAEYTAFHSLSSDNTTTKKTKATAAIVAAINRVTGIYETELSVRLQLVANTDIIFTNASTDPYDDSDPDQMLDANQAVIDNAIGNANYDIGHVFSTDGGGLASFEVVCDNTYKAQGVTGTASPTGDLFWIDYVAHEIGHQFGADHTFNSTTGSCGDGNRNPTTAYEPGSGSTIMGYAGLCDGDDLQSASSPYFHTTSYDEIMNYIDSTSCAATALTGNTIPSVQAGPDFTIPANTPFELTAAGSDANGSDVLTYTWEERDLGPATSISAADNGSSPLFRSWPPTTDPTRSFPRLSNLLNNTFAVGEKLPTTNRTMNFRVTVRDNRSGGGGINQDDMQVTVRSSAGPFQVTAPNTAGLTFTNTLNVNWDVANTTSAPISTSAVDILLSTDGGNTFPITLLTGTPNDGAQSVALPATATSTARIKVKASGNAYFDISNFDFTISPPSGPVINIDDIAITEGNSGSKQAIFTVTLSQVVGSTVAMNYSTSNVTATSGSDYISKSGSLSFPSGTTSLPIEIDIIGDTTSEADETFHVNLSTPTNATIADPTGTGTILNDDFSTPQFSSPSTASGQLGGLFSFQLIATQSPTIYSYTGTLPPGIDFDTATGLFFGTPTSLGSFPLSVSATNPAGTGTSALTITITDTPLNNATDNNNLTWTTGGNNPWTRITGGHPTSYDGIDAARSGSITNNQESWIQTSVTGPDTMFFYWKSSSEPIYDSLDLFLDDTLVASISGETAWRQHRIDIPAGTHTLRWSYTKDESGFEGSDAAYLDLVRLLSQTTVPILDTPPIFSAGRNLPFNFQVTASGSPTNYAATSLPAGLSISPSTGKISGTPTTNGTYNITLSATNGSGTGSAPLIFIVGTPLSFDAALDTPPGLFTWIGGGTTNWVTQSSVTSDGVDALRSGNTSNSQDSILQTTINGPDVLAFHWNVSSEEGYDYLDFEIDGQLKEFISGTPGWSRQVFTIPPGPHHVRWRYFKDISNTVGADVGYLDNVSLTSETLEITTFDRDGSNIIISFPTDLGVIYTVHRSNNLNNWTPIQTNIAGTGGIITRTDIGGGSGTRNFYRITAEAP